jgi:uncharacterized protein involved in outer membrane biogenesis
MKLRPLSRRARRAGWCLLLGVTAFTVGGFFVLPPIIKSQLQQRLGAELGRTVTVGQVRLNPFALSVTLEDFALREADGTAVFVGWRRLRADFEALASLRGDWVLGKIELDGLRAAVRVRPDGALNFSDILAKLAARPAGPDSPPGRALHLVRLHVSEARIDFADDSRTQPFTTVVGPLTFEVSDLHTGGARRAPYRFAAATEAGEKIAWQGTLHAAPFRSSGELTLENILLAKYAPYYREFTRTDLADGKLTVRARYEVNLDTAQRRLRLVDGAVQLRSLKVMDRANQETVFELPALDVAGIHADAIAATADVASVALTGGHLRARREKDGTLNLQNLLQPASDRRAPPSKAATAPGARAPAPPPAVTIGELALKDFKVDLQDLATPRAAPLALTGLQFSLRSVSLAEGASMPLHLAFALAPQGAVRLDGSVTFNPEVRVALHSELSQLALPPFSPYLEQFAHVHLTQGTFSAKNDLRFELKAGTPQLSLEGDLQVENLGVVDGARQEELAGFATLTIAGLKVASSPQIAVGVREVKLAGPYARVVVQADKSLNLAKLVPAAPSAGKPPAPSLPPAPATPAVPAPQITIDKFLLADGDFSFADLSVAPPVRTTLGKFGGSLSGLSSANLARADVALKGVVDGAGPVVISGRLDPLGADKFVDLTIDFKNVDLVPFSPYAGKFAGFELARGKLIVDTKFHLEGTKVDATNVVTLNQLTFGAPVASPDATQLPVRLGVALLKDLDGRIVIDLPIQGKLDDPEFKIGRVIGRVLVNLLTKAAVSPFKLLGSMFGGGGDELAYQEFAPGSSTLQPGELGKLATLVKALANRPALSVALEGGFDTAADTHALKELKLTERIRRALWEDRRAKDPNVAPPEKLVITPAEEAAMIKRLYDQQFPPGTEFGTPLPQPPAVVQPPAPPASLFQRLVRTVTRQNRRDLAAAQAENSRRAREHQRALDAALAGGRPMAEMLGRLAEKIEVTRADLSALAVARAQRVRDHLAGPGQVASDRLFLAQGTEAAQGTKGPRVTLSLQ